MERFFRLFKAGERDTYLTTEGGLPEGYDGWEVEEVDRLPGWMEYREAGAWKIDGSALNAFFHQKIDREAAEFRSNFVTNTPGQMAVYTEKEKQARAYKLNPLEEDIALLQAEAAVRGITVAQLADMVIARAEQWKTLNAKIEARRIRAKEAVKAAAGEQAKLLAASVNWGAIVQ